jgi:hypothetical protein
VRPCDRGGKPNGPKGLPSPPLHHPVSIRKGIENRVTCSPFAWPALASPSGR